MRLIVTRPEEDAEPLAVKLAAMGHEAIVAPLLRIAPRADVVIADRPFRAVIATSANAIRVLASHAAFGELRHLPILTVGPQSLAAARATGFADAAAAGGDAIGLARHIAASLPAAGPPLLYVSGAATAGDLAGHLRAAGFTIERVILYDAVPATRLGVDLAQADGVLLYSPRTARLWSELAGDAARHLVHFCLSANVADALPDIMPRRVAARPDEAAMMALLSRT
jgi:uroporphyrinogen-III synthase